MNRLAGAALAILMTLYATAAHADVITDWNQNTLEVLKVANFAGNPWSRAMAMVHTAMSDAVNSVQPRYTRYAAAAPVTQAGVVPPGGRPIPVPFALGDAPMAEQQTATCPECSRMISPEDTIVFGFGILGHLDCRRPRVLSAEERTLLFIYCRGHQVGECISLHRKIPPARGRLT